MQQAKTAQEYRSAKAIFESLGDFSDAAEKAEACENSALECLYILAKKAMEKANSEEAFKEAAAQFQKLNSYKDAKEQTKKCTELAEERRKSEIYNRAIDLKRKDTIEDLEEAIRVFESIAGFQDADDEIERCKNRIEEIKAEEKRKEEEKVHQEAVRIKEAKRCKQRNKIIASVSGGVIVVAIAFVIALNKVIIPSSKYNTAMEYYENGDYENAISAFEELGDYQDSVDMIKQANYDLAMKYYENGDYATAYTAFDKLGDYSDASEKMAEIKEEHPYESTKDGDIIEFGGYNWIVLNKTEDTMLIITEDIIEERAYNEKNDDEAWEECTLRTYLNETFYNSFSIEERLMIAKTSLTNLDNLNYGTDAGNDTTDKIFLLSLDEAERYMTEDERFVNSNWWLRSPGNLQRYAAGVGSDGDIYSYGIHVSNECGARPALWLKF